MKKIFVILLALSTLLYACGDPEVEEFTDDDIADLVEADMASIDQSVAQAGAIASETESTSICGSGNDTTISFTSQSGDFSTTANWGYEIVCTNNFPTGISSDFALDSDLDKTRFSAENKLDGDFLLDNLLSQNNYLLGGSILSESNMTTKSQRGQKSYSASTTYTIQNMEFHRTTYEILSGTMTIKAQGNGQNGGSFSREATLVFNGNRSATLTLDNGTVYTITW